MSEAKKIIDEFIDEIADRWEKGFEAAQQGNIIWTDLLRDIPKTPGSITYQELLDELRSRK